MSGPLSVLWEDPHGLAVDKPAGLLTQGRPGGEETLEDRVRRHLRPEDPASIYLGTVHRLDRPVTGVVLWAKTARSARRWAEQFAGRSARKEYWAIVEFFESSGTLPEFGIWEDWLGPPDGSGRVWMVEPGTTQAALARTRFEVVEKTGLSAGLAWLKLRPETGRTHQLRVQASARGLPIVGDATYGATLPFPSGIALHARGLIVEHPTSRRPIVVESPPPASWAGWLAPSWSGRLNPR